MAAVTSTLKSGAKALTEPLVTVGLKAVLDVPVGGLVAWVKSRFHDHSAALPKAIAAANHRAWQAVGLALAGESLLSRIAGLFRDGDLKAVQARIRAFVTDADTGLDGQPVGLRARACDELNRLQRSGLLGADVQLESVDLTRFASTATVADDAHRAVRQIADDLADDAPHLAKVLTLTPPGGGTPLLAAAFAYFLRMEIRKDPGLAAELTHDQLRLLSQKQQAGFANLETALGDKFESLQATLGGWFATTDAVLDEILAELKRFRDANQVQTKPESPLRVSVTNEDELAKLRNLRDRLRGLPPEILDAKLQSLFGDGLAAAGQFDDAAAAQQAAADAAKEDGNAGAEADAAFKQFKALCELKNWEDALVSLDRAIARDPKRFRPVPRHYEILGVLGAGAFGVILTCLNKICFDDDGVQVLCAVKVFRETDLDRTLKDVFAEAHALKAVSHPNVIRVLDHGFADAETQERPFLAMEYFEGMTLEDWLATHGKLSEADFRAVFAQVAAGLHAAHSTRRAVIHRDVKPSNILVRKLGGAWQVKVIDFGLAVKSSIRTTSRVASQHVPAAQRSTHDKSVTGTIKYAAPEQLGEKAYPVGPWSDVFAFGNTALEALFGTVKPGPKHWKQLPDDLTDLLSRCVDEEFDPKNPAEGRFHGFAPILELLAPRSPGGKGDRGEEDKPPAAVSPPTPVPPPPPPAKTDPRVEPKPEQPVGWMGRALGSVVNLAAKVGLPLTSVTRAALPSPASAPARKAGEQQTILLPGKVPMAFAWCPPGTFLMGSPASEKDRGDDEQQHEVTLTKGFWVDIHPVTQAQWRAVMGTDPSHFKGDTLPVENVSWDDAVKFCATLKQKGGVELRLPTEAEWEYAARGGTSTPFYWGTELNGKPANCDGNDPYGTSAMGPCLRTTTAVGSYAKAFPHPWGLTDVIGNVWEWCADWYGSYLVGATVDPTGPDNGSLRVSRGGSWLSNARCCRAAFRRRHTPGNRHHSFGFRLAAGPSGLK